MILKAQGISDVRVMSLIAMMIIPSFKDKGVLSFVIKTADTYSDEQKFLTSKGRML